MVNTLDEMTALVQKFCEDRDWDQFHSPKELAIGLVTESSELLDHFRFQSGEQIKNMFEITEKKQAIEDEVADVLFFLLRFAQMNQLNLPDLLKRKIEKNALKYPVEKARSNNQKYDQLK